MAGTGPIPLVNIPVSQYAVPQDVVTTQIDRMSDRAQKSLIAAQEAIQNIAAWAPTEEPAPPDLRPPSIDLPPAGDVSLPSASDLGGAGDFHMPSFEDLSALVDGVDVGDIPEFTPSIDSLNIPDAPAPIDTSGAPQRPTLDAIDLPTAPDVALPAAPDLVSIAVPGAPAITLPTFDAKVPTFDDVPPPAALNWVEPEYKPLVVNELAATIKSMLTGGFAMPEAVQDALLGAARSREDATARKAVEEATDEWAARGFTEPPGMLAEQVSAVRQQNQLQVNALSREVFAKAAEWQIENLRTAVSQGIALESALMQQFDRMAQRSFEAARAELSAAMERFNALVAAHNARMASINTLVAVFQAKVQAELSKLEEYKARIEAEGLKGKINADKMQVYTGKIQALQLLTEQFKSKLDGAKIQSDIEGQKLQAYKTSVDAWAQELAADKVRFDAYKTQTQAEASKAQLLEAESRAFAATIDGYRSKNNVKISTVNAKLRAIEASVQKFTGMLQAEVAKSSAGLDVVKARTQTMVADTQRYAAQIGATNRRAELKVRVNEAEARNNMAYFGVVSQQFDARMNRVLEQSKTVQQGLESIAQMVSQLAAGAMSATHVGATISNGANTSLSASQSYTVANNVTDYFKNN